MKLLNGTDKKRENIWKKVIGNEEETTVQDISREEIQKQIKKLKKGKASGEDNIQNEAWIHIQGRTKEKTYELIRNVWKGEKIPEEWRTSLISSLFKKGERDVAGRYRGILLLSVTIKSKLKSKRK